MSFNVRPWSREQHTFWLSKPFGLDINSWFEVRVCTFVTVEVLPEQCNDSAVLTSVAAAMLWLCMVGGGRGKSITQ